MRFMLITSLIALALAGIVVSCSAEVQPTPAPTHTPTPTLLETYTQTEEEIQQGWERSRKTPFPTRIPTPTPPGYPLTVTVRAGYSLTGTAEVNDATAFADSATAFADAAADPTGFARTVARGESRHCSYQDYRRVRVAIKEGKETLTGSEFAVLVQAAIDAADCTEFPSHKDSEFLRCVRQSLVFVIPHYQRIGAKPLRDATDRESSLLSTATRNSWNGLVSCHPSWVNLDPERERDWLLDLTDLGLY